MKKLLLLTISLMVLCTISAKDTYTYKLVKPNGEPVEEYVYPGLANYYGYTIVLSPSPNGFSKGDFEVKLTNGKFSDGTTQRKNVQANANFTVTWDDVSSATGTIVILKATAFDTANVVLKAGTPIQMSHKIASLKGQTPGLSVSDNPLIGSKQVITAQITTEATYPNIQEYIVTEGTINKRAEYYEWTLPANWTAAGQNGNTFIIGAQQKSITITPDNVTSGAVKIRALNSAKTAGSETRSITLDRGLVYTAYPTSITFGDNSPKIFTVTPFNGITYEWSVPSNWKINGQGNTFEGLNQNSINVIPDFCPLTDTKVKVRLKKDGDVSQWYDFPAYTGVKQPTISSATGTIYQYENVDFSLSDIFAAGINSISWSGDGVLVQNNQGANSKITFTKSGPITLIATILMNGCSTSLSIPKTITVNPNRLSITGSPEVCNSGQYIINNLAAGNTVAWSAIPSGIITIQQNGNSATITRVGNGSGWVQATVNGAVLFKYAVYAGSLDQTKIVSSRAGQAVGAWAQYHILCKSGSTSAVAGYDANGDGESLGDAGDPSSKSIVAYDWSFPSGWSYSNTSTGISKEKIQVSSSGNVTAGTIVQVGIRVQNGCGWSPWRYDNWQVVSCGGGFGLAVSPNPASNQVQVNLDENEDASSETVATTASTTPVSSYTVKILDSYGHMYYSTTKCEKRFNLPVSSLPNGVYTVVVSDGSVVDQKKLFVKH